jgi:LEA14-like dessication related protein
MPTLPVLANIVVLSLSACATLSNQEPIQVIVAGVEPLQGEGLEARMLVKLRVQNPNDAPLAYEGVYVKLDVLNKPFATGVSDERGSVPRYGEAVIGVPVTISTLRVGLNALGFALQGKMPQKVNYTLNGKLGGGRLWPVTFHAEGELSLPGQFGQ